jgi:glycine betaine/proline transport system ATP-binding protein
MAEDNNIIMRVEHLYKIFETKDLASDAKKALKLLKEGKSHEEVKEKADVVVAVDDVSFEVERGEIFVLIGLSGSGKSTIIRCLNRIHEPTAGAIWFEDKDVTKFDEKELRDFRRQKIAMVFQHFGLMDHMNVIENVAYGLEIRGVDKATREKKALEMLDLVELTGWGYEPIDSLSGGMKQRVGIARALANDPKILVMDEAFSALDPLVRNELQFELLSIQEKTGTTIVFITHDINEAFKLGSKIGILRDGKMIQVATPEEMLTNPATDYVEKFIDNVDSSQVFSVKHILSKPGSIVHLKEGALTALKSMKVNEVSSAYVVDEKMKFVGVITLVDAIRVKEKKMTFQEAITTDIETIDDIEMSIADIVPIAANAIYPIPVVRKDGTFRGIVSKAAVLSSMLLEFDI